MAPRSEYVKRTFIPLIRAFAILLVVGCADSGPAPASVDGNDGCPNPAGGITIGGSGGASDTQATPVRRIVLMGGGSEDDHAASLFVEAASGGDLLILRATGSTTSYPNYFTRALSPSLPPASAITVRTDLPALADDPSVLCRLSRAEAVWLAGGSQWDYLGGWPQELHDSLAAFVGRGGAMGGTSAGAVSLGEAAFDAREGSVTSEEALLDPLRSDVSIAYPTFFPEELRGVLVDSHFSERTREGRLLAFLGRFLAEQGRADVVGIGLDEGMALVVEGGRFAVFGPEGGGVWAYRVAGPAEIAVGAPLALSGIKRVRLGVGTEGVWPPDFSILPGVDLEVRAGAVLFP